MWEMDGPSQELERPQEGPPDDTPRWCTVESCRRRPFFGPMGGRPIFCQQHSKKSEGMVDVSSRRCEAVGCAKWPLYGNEVSRRIMSLFRPLAGRGVVPYVLASFHLSIGSQLAVGNQVRAPQFFLKQTVCRFLSFVDVASARSKRACSLYCI